MRAQPVALTAVTITFLVCACGGDDSVQIPLPGNEGGADSSTTSDANGGQDTGTNDTGIGADATPVDSGGPDNSQPFNPGGVNGLVLWLDAAKGVQANAGHVQKWADQTSFKNDASQFISGRQPVVNNGVINSLPALHFDKGGGGQNSNGSMVLINDAASLQWNTGDFYVVVVGQFDNIPSDGLSRGSALLYSKAAFGWQNNPPTQTGPALYGNQPGIQNNTPALGLFGIVSTQGSQVTSTSSPYNTLKPHQFAVQRVGGTLSLRVDGQQVSQQAQCNANVDAVGTAARIGADGDAAFTRMNGDIAEVLAVKGQLSGNDQSGLEGYLKNKYGL